MSTNNSFDIDAYVAEVRELAGAVFIQVRLDYARYLRNSNAAFALAYIINQINLSTRHRKDIRRLEQNEGWSRCPSKLMGRHLGMSDEKIHAAMVYLVKKKIVKTEHRNGNTLWVKLNAGRLQLMREADVMPESGKRGFRKTRIQNPENADSESGKRGFPHTNKSTKNQQQCPQADGVSEFPLNGTILGEASPDHSPWDLECAKKLLEALAAKRKIMAKPNIKKWAGFFAEIRRHIDKERVEKALAWYLPRIGQQYMPEAFSAEGFGNKFISIEHAMDKAEEESKGRRITYIDREVVFDDTGINPKNGCRTGTSRVVETEKVRYEKGAWSKDDSGKKVWVPETPGSW